MQITLETLVKAQTGEKEAQDTLMLGLYTPVYHFMLKRTGSDDTADELTQTTFLKCYQRLNHYDQKLGTVYTWVFTIARNTLIDFYKKKKDELLEEPADVIDENSSHHPTRLAEERMSSEYVSRILNELDEHEADVVTLRAIDEMPYEQIAKIIDKSPEATRQIYSRAIQKMRNLVANQQSYEQGK